jgi:O-acetyl-ADP-ribose deacetylase (regulator of RNase III)
MNEAAANPDTMETPPLPAEPERQDLETTPDTYDSSASPLTLPRRGPRPLTSAEHPCGVILECVVGSIGFQPDVDAIVLMTSPLLVGERTAATALGGPSVVPTVPGQAVMDAQQRQLVIQCLGPASAASPAADVLLARCYRSALKLASTHGVTSIAFASIATGPLAYTINAVARIGCRAIVTELARESTIRRVRFVSPLAADGRAFARGLSEALTALQESTTPARPVPVASGRTRRW